MENDDGYLKNVTDNFVPQAEDESHAFRPLDELSESDEHDDGNGSFLKKNAHAAAFTPEVENESHAFRPLDELSESDEEDAGKMKEEKTTEKVDKTETDSSGGSTSNLAECKCCECCPYHKIVESWDTKPKMAATSSTESNEPERPTRVNRRRAKSYDGIESSSKVGNRRGKVRPSAVVRHLLGGLLSNQGLPLVSSGFADTLLQSGVLDEEGIEECERDKSNGE